MSSNDIAGVFGFVTTCDGIYGTCINPPFLPAYFLWIIYNTPYITWLHTNVPAEFETDDGIPPSCISLTMALIGKLEKYAFSPSSNIAISIGWFPSLSSILASSILIATLSGVTPNLPPACPIDIIISGLCSCTASSIFSNAFLKTVGISNLITSAPEISLGNFLTASNAGFIFSPPNGSNPVINTFISISPLSLEC